MSRPTLNTLLAQLQSHPTIRTRSQALFELRFLAQHAYPTALPTARGAPPSTLAGLTHALATQTEDLSRLAVLVTQRTRHSKPLQYILGSVPFGHGLDLVCRPPVLIPRPETDQWVERVAGAWLGRTPPRVVVDLCSGSGCASLGLLSYLDAAAAPAQSGTSVVVGVDVDPRAVDLANENALRTGYAGRARYVLGDVLTLADAPDAVPLDLGTARVDLVLANPPYIAQGELAALDTDVRQWEAPQALVGGPRGSEFYPVVARLAWRMLTAGMVPSVPSRGQVKGGEGPVVAMEIGHDQGDEVRKMVGEWFEGVEVWQDYAGRDRCVVGKQVKRF